MPLPTPGFPLPDRAVSWAGLACSVKMPSLATAWRSPTAALYHQEDEASASWGKVPGPCHHSCPASDEPGDTIPEAWPEGSSFYGNGCLKKFSLGTGYATSSLDKLKATRLEASFAVRAFGCPESQLLLGF